MPPLSQHRQEFKLELTNASPFVTGGRDRSRQIEGRKSITRVDCLVEGLPGVEQDSIAESQLSVNMTTSCHALIEPSDIFYLDSFILLALETRTMTRDEYLALLQNARRRAQDRELLKGRASQRPSHGHHSGSETGPTLARRLHHEES